MLTSRLFVQKWSSIQIKGSRSYHMSSMLCGGSRPGGKPTFNWKQKLLLKEDQQIEETSQTAKFLDYGRLQNVPKLEKFFNSMKGVEATDGFNADEYFQSLDPSTLPDLEDYQISILTQGKKAKEKRIRNPKYKIVRATLFGSHKVGFKLGSEETKKKPKFVRFGKNTGEITA